MSDKITGVFNSTVTGNIRTESETESPRSGPDVHTKQGLEFEHAADSDPSVKGQGQHANELENLSTDESDHNVPEPGNKRIILQRFTIYNSLTTMYIVGSNAKESLFRVLEINKDPEDDENLNVIEDRSFFYTRQDMVELINELNDTIDGGLHKVTRGYGIIGLIRFTRGYYLSLITKCSQVAVLGGHYVYHIDETKLIPLDIHYSRPVKYSDEERLLSIFKYLDLGKTFYFSYSYDITNTLQTNFMRFKEQSTTIESPSDSNARQNVDGVLHNDRFVWNQVLLKPLENQEIAINEWFQPIIHGFVDQANISIYGKKIYITIIARRSHHFAGARFLKRGVNDKGDVANEVETEQIVSDMMTTSFHDPTHGFYNNPRYTSFVQHRGSIPLYWSQDLNKLPKPPIEITLSDPYYESSAVHFNNLLRRYGLPVIILNLIKTKEKHPRELKLNHHFNSCIRYLNQFLPEGKKLQYHSFDMSRHSKKNLDVIGPLQLFASDALKETGYFHNGLTLEDTKLQRGIIRTNCIDCLDRTNAAQFITCKEALSQQLSSLGLFPEETSLDYDSDLINILTEMFHDHGDTIAVQYGGSNLVNTMDSYRRINQWSSHTRDMLNSVKRMYSNSFMDSIRQEAINLFLGNYVYDASKPKLWELQNDFYLHNEYRALDIRNRRSYMHWFNSRYFDATNISSAPKMEKTSTNGKIDQSQDHNDNWFNECYVPRKFQSMLDLFQFNMNSNARYFPAVSNMDFDYSPFKSRKPFQKEAKIGTNRQIDQKNDGNENVRYLDTCDTATILRQPQTYRMQEGSHSSYPIEHEDRSGKGFLQNYALRHLISNKQSEPNHIDDQMSKHARIEQNMIQHLYGEMETRNTKEPTAYYVSNFNLQNYKQLLKEVHVDKSNQTELTYNLQLKGSISTYEDLILLASRPYIREEEHLQPLRAYMEHKFPYASPVTFQTQDAVIRDDYFAVM